MSRMQLAVIAMVALFGASAAGLADDLKTSQLEQDVRSLQRQVQGLSRQVDDLQRQLTRAGNRPKPPSSTAAPANTDSWLDADKWRRLKPGMSELEVVSSLGAPTSMRNDGGDRMLFYAMEIGASGFLGGSVRLRERVVVEIEAPSLH